MASRFTRILPAAFAAVALALAGNACHGDKGIPTGAATSTGGGASTTTVTGTGSTSTGTGGSAPASCPTTFTFQPGSVVSNPRIAGEWNGFDPMKTTPMSGPSASGVYTATINLPPGLQAYKVVYKDGSGSDNWVLNPSEGRRKYVNGTENSAIKVRDCSLPTFDVGATATARPSPGNGTFTASLTYVAPLDGTPLDPAGYQAVLQHDDTMTALSSAQATVSGSNVSISLNGLSDGKYRVVLTPKSQSGKTGEAILLVFWIEKEAFSWRDALIYMVVTDRYRDGDPSNNAPPTPNADPRGDWKGGDLEGVTQSINDGTFDALGVRALWLTPYNTNPPEAFAASDGIHQVTGYHGYWPIKGRQVDPRIGGEAALHALVKAAHAHGIRILQDYVLHHVHKEHEYIAAHPDWFRMGCVCGTNNCDWTAHAQDCVFTDYLPNVNYAVPEAAAQMVDDAVWWIDTFDLDGLRMDAVKHVPELATRNTVAEVRETFEKANTKYFLMGETAMGWNNCADPCNDDNYGTIAKYIGPLGLDGQFDFVLYHGVSYNTFAYGDKGMIHADYWFQHGQSKWPAGAIMTPYIGSHDTARFATLADYRGQDAAHDRGIPGNQWDNTAVAPSDSEPYRRTRIGLSWLINLPGAPLLYYGDEYGQWGGSDPNNRLMWRPASALDADETATLSFVRKLGTARAALPELRRGDYVALDNTDDNTLVFARKVAQGDAAIVGLTRLTTNAQVTFDVLASLGFSAGTTLHDAMGGPDVTVAANGTVTLNIPASSTVVLHP